MKKILLILCILLNTAVCVQAQSDKPDVLLIIPFDNATGKEQYNSLREGMPDLITVFLSPYHDHITIVERNSMEAVFTEKSLSWEGFNNEETYAKLGQLSQANMILRGSVNLVGHVLGVNAALYNTQTTSMLKSFESTGSSEDLTAIAKEVAIQISKYLKTEINEFPELPTEEDPERSLNMINAMGYYYNGQYVDATTYLLKILEAHPDDETAHYYLAKSFEFAGMGGHAKNAYIEFIKKYPESPRSDEFREIVNNY